ncbi:hypothetical protein XACM_3948 [Xanthomonas euvesicatoria pv. citrumelo F1]|nr:hypothetical protein XACM_3948 [Xanthomonas euvesicatoria pv. citrumelo F1]
MRNLTHLGCFTHRQPALKLSMRLDFHEGLS